ncbi:DUF192 domain-containing protein [Halovivax limisalsi]|uniref:DUF192 domain-containing protein n=1 Tax=Halovivax limisalsi TaxID=1453760 RepID=UPI001FFCFEF0|nr:DUF192 domain-containing protein [Halovivax limisalsi]
MSDGWFSANRRRVLLALGGTVASSTLAGCAGGIEWPGDGPGGPEDIDAADPGPANDSSADGDGDDGSSNESTDGGSTEPEIHAGYETTEVVVTDDDGIELGSVTAAIADTRDLRYLGLSDTESLPEDRGMLFVYDSVADRTFVMREMDFGIDIVYADADGQITAIHHAPAPGPDEDGESMRYPGRGQYVLEVNYEWTAERGIEVGHSLDWGRSVTED